MNSKPHSISVTLLWAQHAVMLAGTASRRPMRTQPSQSPISRDLRTGNQRGGSETPRIGLAAAAHVGMADNNRRQATEFEFLTIDQREKGILCGASSGGPATIQIDPTYRPGSRFREPSTRFSEANYLQQKGRRFFGGNYRRRRKN